MSYTQTVIDNFNTNTIDGSKWQMAGGGAGITATSQALHIAASASYPQFEGITPRYNITTGILAVKFGKTGTATTSTEFYFGLGDGAATPNRITLTADPSRAYLEFNTSGAATFSNPIINDTTVGLGPTWTNGTWLGISIDNGNVVRAYKSTDGQTWTQIAQCTLGGTFNKANAALYLMAGVWDGTTSPYVADIDDPSFWLNSTTSVTVSKVKVMVGGGWVTLATPAKVKVRVGGAWVALASNAKVKKRVGNTWV